MGRHSSDTRQTAEFSTQHHLEQYAILIPLKPPEEPLLHALIFCSHTILEHNLGGLSTHERTLEGPFSDIKDGQESRMSIRDPSCPSQGLAAAVASYGHSGNSSESPNEPTSDPGSRFDGSSPTGCEPLQEASYESSPSTYLTICHFCLSSCDANAGPRSLSISLVASDTQQATGNAATHTTRHVYSSSKEESFDPHSTPCQSSPGIFLRSRSAVGDQHPTTEACKTMPRSLNGCRPSDSTRAEGITSTFTGDPYPRRPSHYHSFLQ